MTQAIEFHTGIADPLDFTCRLLRKAYRQGAQVLCTAPEPWLSRLDAQLWTFDERDFVPHLRLAEAAISAPTALAQRTPIWLAPAVLEQAQGRILVNVGADAPEQPPHWARVIELVAQEESAAQAGRQRWRAYQAAGHSVTHLGAASAKA